MLTVEGSILPMRYIAPAVSGTVLWSALLPASRETVVTHTGLGLGGACDTCCRCATTIADASWG